jgi:hypothetical protein
MLFEQPLLKNTLPADLQYPHLNYLHSLLIKNSKCSNVYYFLKSIQVSEILLLFLRS